MKILTVGLTGLLLASFVLGIGALMGALVAWCYNVALALRAIEAWIREGGAL